MVKEMSIRCHWFGEHIWLSLVGSEVEAGEKVGKLAVMDRVLIVLGRLLGFWFGFLGYLLLRVWVGVLIEPLSIGIISLSR